ncbi:MAG TPA: hypothetical protein VGH13_05875 [Xanthobacteraceae bacterium]|jgi:hypothetical protein
MQIEVAKTVAARPIAAFAIVSNVVDWPDIIRSVSNIEVLTPGPIRVGTRMREDRVMFGAMSTHELEIATLERPRRLHLLVSHPNLHFELDHLIDGVYGGSCRMMLILRSRPASVPEQTLQPLMAPFMSVTLRDELEQDLSDLATAVRRHVSAG